MHGVYFAENIHKHLATNLTFSCICVSSTFKHFPAVLTNVRK